MVEPYKFNISYSAINVFLSCQRNFKYGYLDKLPQEAVVKCYGESGTVAHETIEHCYNKDTVEARAFFDKEWSKYNLDTTNRDPFGRLLPKEKYWASVVNGMNSGHNIIKFEEKFVVEGFHLIKGFVDALAKDEEGREIVVDWKTSSSIDSKMKNQLKFYCYLYYMKYKRIPYKGVLEFIKIDKKLEHIYSMADVHEVQKKIQDFINEVYAKKKFEDWSYDKTGKACFFCAYKERCAKANSEKATTQEAEPFSIIIGKNGRFKFGEPHATQFMNKIDELFSFKAVDDETLAIIKRKPSTPPYMMKWDGIIHMKKYNSYQIGLLPRMKKYISQYESATGKDCHLTIKDMRKPVGEVVKLPKGKNAHILRWYQEEAVLESLNKKMGILACCTSSGKTVIAIEIYRKNPVNTLFIIDRKILLTQTRKEFSEQLDISEEDMGTITDGEMNIVGNLTFATIQTLAKRVKEKDAEMIKYLSRVEQVITDEAHVSKNKSFKLLFDKVPNAYYRFGLTGTPETSVPSFMEIEANIGNVIYEISAKQLISEGTIMKPEINFLRYEHGMVMEGSFQDEKQQLYENEGRNEKIIDIIQKHNGEVQILLVERISHGEFIQGVLEEMGYDTFFIQGKVSEKQREKILEDARNKNTRVLISTSQITSKGLNLKPLSVIINATGNAGNVMTVQSLGRILRKDGESKIKCFYYDFYDLQKHFDEHRESRISSFKREGHKVKILEEI